MGVGSTSVGSAFGVCRWIWSLCCRVVDALFRSLLWLLRFVLVVSGCVILVAVLCMASYLRFFGDKTLLSVYFCKVVLLKALSLKHRLFVGGGLSGLAFTLVLCYFLFPLCNSCGDSVVFRRPVFVKVISLECL